MELLVKINKYRAVENDISRIMKYLKSQSCVSKLNLISDDFKTVKKISDKNTVNAIHYTTSKALTKFLEKENESIF